MFGTNVKMNLGRSGNKTNSFFEALAFDKALNGGLKRAGLFACWAFYHHWKDIRMTDADIQQSKMGYSLREISSKESQLRKGTIKLPDNFETLVKRYQDRVNQIVCGDMPLTDLIPEFMTPVYYNTDGYPIDMKKGDKTCCGLLFRPFTPDEIDQVTNWLESCIKSK